MELMSMVGLSDDIGKEVEIALVWTLVEKE